MFMGNSVDLPPSVGKQRRRKQAKNSSASSLCLAFQMNSERLLTVSSATTVPTASHPLSRLKQMTSINDIQQYAHLPNDYILLLVAHI